MDKSRWTRSVRDGGRPWDAETRPRFSLLHSDLSASIQRLKLKPPNEGLFRASIWSIMAELHAFDTRDECTSQDRRQMLGEINRLVVTLGKVQSALSSGPGTLMEIRRALAPVVGPYLSLHAFEQSHVTVDTEISIHTVQTRAAMMREGPYRALEDEITLARTSAAKHSGERVLMVVARDLQAALEKRLRFLKHGRRGPKGDQPRRIVIVGLALEFQELFGRRPTETENGAFVKLCEEVLSLFALSTDGLAKAVGRVLKDMRV